MSFRADPVVRAAIIRWAEKKRAASKVAISGAFKWCKKAAAASKNNPQIGHQA
jgi:hypothetical protein